MIISLKEDFDKELGTSLPMISRAGKSTIPEHLCFSNAPGNKKEFTFSRKDEQENDDFTILIGQRKPSDMQTEMAKIAETENQNRKQMTGQKGAKGHSKSKSLGRRARGLGYIPWNQKYKDEYTTLNTRQKSSCFITSSRDAWARAHASKTNPPEVGKYKPRYSQVEKRGLKADIRP